MDLIISCPYCQETMKLNSQALPPIATLQDSIICSCYFCKQTFGVQTEQIKLQLETLIQRKSEEESAKNSIQPQQIKKPQTLVFHQISEKSFSNNSHQRIIKPNPKPTLGSDFVNEKKFLPPNTKIDDCAKEVLKNCSQQIALRILSNLLNIKKDEAFIKKNASSSIDEIDIYKSLFSIEEFGFLYHRVIKDEDTSKVLNQIEHPTLSFLNSSLNQNEEHNHINPHFLEMDQIPHPIHLANKDNNNLSLIDFFYEDSS